MCALQVDGIQKSYGQRVVLRSVSLVAERGEVVALLGPNGAGKTTFFYTIAGLVLPDSGQVILEGADVSRLPLYRRARLGLGYLPQEPSIFRGMTVRENIMAVLQRNYKEPRAREAKFESLVDDFSIGHILKTYGPALSGGERRRVEIARALASDPLYILLDEPFAGVDPIAVDDIRTLVGKLTKKNIGVIITDHNVHETLKIVNQAYILYDGEVLASGSAEDIVQNQTVQEVYLGRDFAQISR